MGELMQEILCAIRAAIRGLAGQLGSAASEGEQMVILELLDQADGLLARVDELSRVRAGIHGPPEQFLNDVTADRITFLRRERAWWRLQELNYKDYPDRVVS